MPAEGGDGTHAFLQKLGPYIDFILGEARCYTSIIYFFFLFSFLSRSTGQQLTRRVAGVAYYRQPKHTNQKQLAGGIAVLSGGKRPTTVDECQQWMDANMGPACKAVRVVPARALGRRA
eukprot:COSAG01_NODE_2842_length_6990_cov_10.019301_15_plen_119_part_00